ncbi:hypothetical protein [Viridibacillus arvi]|uniref:hypothetical protein n=1 Tax=Viridibacillus arvi TaxID=263475 RepID=UPI0034CD8EF5
MITTEKERLILIAANNSAHLNKPKLWNKFAYHNELPSSYEIEETFHTWKEFKKRVYLCIALQNKEYFFISSNWNQYATLNSFPSSILYARIFGSWENVQKIVYGDLPSEELKRISLLSVARLNIAYFSVPKKWVEHSKNRKLPSLDVYKKSFGSWENALKLVVDDKDFTEIIAKKEVEKGLFRRKYTKESILKVASEHIEHFKTVQQWSAFAKENKLPSKTVYIKHFGYFSKAKEAVQQYIKDNYTE